MVPLSPRPELVTRSRHTCCSWSRDEKSRQSAGCWKSGTKHCIVNSKFKLLYQRSEFMESLERTCKGMDGSSPVWKTFTSVSSKPKASANLTRFMRLWQPGSRHCTAALFLLSGDVGRDLARRRMMGRRAGSQLEGVLLGGCFGWGLSLARALLGKVLLLLMWTAGGCCCPRPTAPSALNMFS